MITSLIWSCTTSQFIKVNSNRTADVSISFDNDSIDPFYKSEIVKDFKIDGKDGPSFRILEIDSLGQYLSPLFNPSFFEIKYSNDSLTISDGHGEPFRIKSWECCAHIMTITSDRKISTVKKNGKPIKFKKQKNMVIISKNRKELYNSKTQFTIYFE